MYLPPLQNPRRKKNAAALCTEAQNRSIFHRALSILLRTATYAKNLQKREKKIFS